MKYSARQRLVPGFALIAVLFGLSGESRAAETEDPLAEVKRKLQLVTENQELEEELRTKLQTAYQTAVSFHEQAQAHAQKQQQFEASIESAPQETAQFRQELENLGEALTTNAVLFAIPDTISLTELEQQATSARARLASLENDLATMNDRLEGLQTRPAALRQEQEQITVALNSIEQALQENAPEGDLYQEPVANRTLLLARRTTRVAEAAMLTQEELSLPLRLTRAETERVLLIRRIADQKTRADVMDQALSEKRRIAAAEATRQAQEATREAASKHPLLEKMAQENADLADELEAQVQLIEDRLKLELETINAQKETITQRYQLAQSRIKDIGLSDTLAVRLLDQRRRLPAVSVNHLSLKNRKEKIIAAGNRRLAVEDEQEELPQDPSDAAETETWSRNHYPEDSETIDREGLWAEAGKLLEQRKIALQNLGQEYTRLLQEYEKIDYAENQHIELVEEYAKYLEERLLWIPSAPPVNRNIFRETGEAVRTIFSRSHLDELQKAAVAFPSERPLLTVFLGLFLLTSLGGRPFFRRKELDYAQSVKKLSTDTFEVTLRSLGMLLFQSAPLVLTLALVGWHLNAVETELGLEDENVFSRGLGSSLLYAAVHVFGILVLLKACRPNGLGMAHFRWNPAIAELVRRQLYWFFPVVLCGTILIDFSEEQPDEVFRRGLSRLILIVLMLTTAVLVHITLHPKRGIFSGIIDRSPKGWLHRLQFVWHRGLTLVPIGFAALSALGYHHTAVQLTRQTAITLSFLISAFIVHQLIRRWFLAKERKLKLERWLAARRNTSQNKKDAKGTTEAPLPEIVEEEIDVKVLGEQTQRFLRSLMNFLVLVGIWLIWSDILPALKVLDTVELWHAAAVVDGQSVVQPITLRHIALVLIIIAILTVTVRNISGALEIGILQNLPLQPGSRYAIVTVSQYVVFMIGVVIVFKTLGFTLAQFGWIVTALSVGLGFGLQEVVANFVSGVILLAERPIRVGDIVTVGDVSGVVSRIRIRATTITNWNRQELVVPNKEFITGRILNWTLSNTVNRIVIVAGVAYGTDTEKARELLLRTAQNHPLIMKEPGPMATFEGFDDSSLRLVLRCYLPNLDNRLSVTTELHSTIAREFEKAGIDIAFPHRDIVLHTPGGSPVGTAPQTEERPKD